MTEETGRRLVIGIIILSVISVIVVSLLVIDLVSRTKSDPGVRVVSLKKVLIDPEAVVDPETKNTALHFAVISCNKVLVKTLIEGGADILAKNIEGLTPLHLTNEGTCFSIYRRERAGHIQEEIINTLVSSNWVARDMQDDEGYTPFHYGIKEYKLSVAWYIERVGANVNIPNMKGETALHTAVRNCDDPAMEFLLTETGIDINLRNGEGQTALDLAERKNDSITISLLEENGALRGADLPKEVAKKKE